jgi:hypothetical protein
MPKIDRAVAVTFAVVCFLAEPVFAGPISGLTTFVPGNPALAADVNNNFTIIRNAGNDTDTRVTNVEANRVLKSGDTMSGNLTVPNLTYAVPKVAYWTVQGRGFIHNDGNGYANCFPDTLAWNGNGSSTFRAPINLPHGATITGFTFNYWKNPSALDNSTATLNRTALPATGSVAAMATLTSSATSHSSVTTNTITNPVVDNQNFSYHLVVALGGTAGGHCVDAVTIRYTYVNP